MLRRLTELNDPEGIEMVFTVPIGARRRRALDEFYAKNREQLGAAIGGSDCHFGAHDIASAVTRYEGDFRSAIKTKMTNPERMRQAGKPTTGIALRHQW